MWTIHTFTYLIFAYAREDFQTTLIDSVPVLKASLAVLINSFLLMIKVWGKVWQWRLDFLVKIVPLEFFGQLVPRVEDCAVVTAHEFPKSAGAGINRRLNKLRNSVLALWSNLLQTIESCHLQTYEPTDAVYLSALSLNPCVMCAHLKPHISFLTAKLGPWIKGWWWYKASSLIVNALVVFARVIFCPLFSAYTTP